MTAIVTIGIDLAKHIFAVHGVDATGKPALVRPNVPRSKLLELIASLPPCLIGIEACPGAHHWAREFQHKNWSQIPISKFTTTMPPSAGRWVLTCAALSSLPPACRT